MVPLPPRWWIDDVKSSRGDSRDKGGFHAPLDGIRGACTDVCSRRTGSITAGTLRGGAEDGCRTCGRATRANAGDLHGFPRSRTGGSTTPRGMWLCTTILRFIAATTVRSDYGSPSCCHHRPSSLASSVHVHLLFQARGGVIRRIAPYIRDGFPSVPEGTRVQCLGVNQG
eukprot:scaffold625_cov324-Pavlova_lutheri.AAC.6